MDQLCNFHEKIISFINWINKLTIESDFGIQSWGLEVWKSCQIVLEMFLKIVNKIFQAKGMFLRWTFVTKKEETRVTFITNILSINYRNSNHNSASYEHRIKFHIFLHTESHYDVNFLWPLIKFSIIRTFEWEIRRFCNSSLSPIVSLIICHYNVFDFKLDVKMRNNRKYVERLMALIWKH